MTTLSEAVRAAIPDADGQTIDYVIWERTPFPMVRPTARTAYRAAYRMRRAYEHGLVLCELCDRIAGPYGALCIRCSQRLGRVIEGEKS